MTDYQAQALRLLDKGFFNKINENKPMSREAPDLLTIDNGYFLHRLSEN